MFDSMFANVSENCVNYKIEAPDVAVKDAITQKINNKTKPLGALGRLEELALKIALIQNTPSPELKRPTMVVFAGDHGIASSGVGAYPPEVTYQMVLNFLNGGAAINVFCKQNGIDLMIVDAGVNFDFSSSSLKLDGEHSTSRGLSSEGIAVEGTTNLSMAIQLDDALTIIKRSGGNENKVIRELLRNRVVNAKIARGTRNFLHEKAMSKDECLLAFHHADKIITALYERGVNLVAFGEMGIGNTSASSMIMHKICQIPLVECVGAGTGLDVLGVKKKLFLLEEALIKHLQVKENDPWEVLQTFGGFEIAMICAGMLKAAEHKMIILVDGFIATAAFILAHKINPQVKEYAIFCNLSDERGHKKMLEYLQVEPLINLGLRLGEGSAAALAYPIVKAAVNFLNEMASFDSAQVSTSLS